MEGCVYLDDAASTPLDGRVLKAMLPWMMADQPGNPHARQHLFGAAAHRAVQDARGQIAASIAAAPHEMIFTSGATEANNLVFKGLARYLRDTGRQHIITSAVEHRSVLAPLMALSAQGFRLDILPVKPCGMIEARMAERAITPQTGLLSIQAVNNETGVVQPLAEIAALLRGRDILLHSDAAQAPGKTPFSVLDCGVDFASFSAHKIYGPQGVGAVYARADKQHLLEPVAHGGGQEAGLRSGTLPVALCAGFGAACALLHDDRRRLFNLRNAFLARLMALEPVIYGHADPAWIVPGILCLRFPGIDHEALAMALPGLAFGLGAACGSGGSRGSHVIAAMTGEPRAAQETIRLSFGRFTTLQQAEDAAAQIARAVMDIRKVKATA